MKNIGAIETPISFKAERVDVPAGLLPEEIQDNLVVPSLLARTV